MSSTPSLKVRASFVRLAATCRAVNDIRFYLAGILVEPRKEGGAYIVATNGHHMICIIDPKAEVSAPVLINPSRATVAMLPKVDARDDGEEATVSLVDFMGKPALLVTDRYGLHRHVQVAETFIEAGGQTVKFPDWRKVLPDFALLERGHKSVVNSAYLQAPMIALSRPRFGMSLETWQVPSATNGNSVVCRINGRNDVLHLVMPLRTEEASLQWISDWSMAKKAQA